MSVGGRLARFQQKLTVDLPAVLISHISNIRYLIARPTMFDPDFGGILLVVAEQAVLVVDSRYGAQARAAELPCDVVEYKDNVWEALSDIVKAGGIAKLGFESQYLTVAAWSRLKEKVLVELVPVQGAVEGLRLVKDQAEIDSLAEAALIADEVFSEIVRLIKPGVTEREIALEIDFQLRKRGAEGPSFETIVAGGENSAFPHARAGNRPFGAGDFIKIDFGAVWGGYHSDMTRTVILGGGSDRQKHIYAGVATAQKAALDSLAPGTGAKDVDAAARAYFDSIGMAENFAHNLGHGVGLDVHEQPTLGPKSETELAVGMVFTVEPGLYFPGLGGVRIEDMVVLREHGIQILTNSPKELIEI